MTNTLKQEVFFFNDLIGRVSEDAELFFYEPGSLTPVKVYTNQELDIPHKWPLKSDARGIFPPIYVRGELRLILEEGGVKTLDRDNVFFGENDTESSSKIYLDESDFAQSITVNGEVIPLRENEVGYIVNKEALLDNAGREVVGPSGETTQYLAPVSNRFIFDGKQVYEFSAQVITTNNEGDGVSFSQNIPDQTGLGFDGTGTVLFGPNEVVITLPLTGEIRSATFVASSNFAVIPGEEKYVLPRYVTQTSSLEIRARFSGGDREQNIAIRGIGRAA